MKKTLYWELIQLKKDYKNLQLNSIHSGNEASYANETNTKKVSELVDTTNISRVKILQLMHSIDDLTHKNTYLGSTLDSREKELLQTNANLLLKCQQLETLTARLQLQEKMIDVQTEEIGKLRLDLYNSKVELNSSKSKLQQYDVKTKSQIDEITKLKTELSKLKTLNYSLSKTQTQRTLSITPSSASLLANYNRNNNNRKKENELLSDNETLLKTFNSFDNFNTNTPFDDEIKDPNRDELDDIYDVISQEVLVRRAATARPATNSRISLPQLALESRESKLKAQNRLMTR